MVDLGKKYRMVHPDGGVQIVMFEEEPEPAKPSLAERCARLINRAAMTAHSTVITWDANAIIDQVKTIRAIEDILPELRALLCAPQADADGWIECPSGVIEIKLSGNGSIFKVHDCSSYRIIKQ